jgi:sulfur carrier protein
VKGHWPDIQLACKNSDKGPTAEMKLQINGDLRHFPESLSLQALIQQLGMKADRVAVELNREIVSRENWDATILSDGDRLEVVHFVGGGWGTNLNP